MADDKTDKTAENPAASGPGAPEDTDWKAKLSREQYEVTRNAGTERAFSGEYCDTKTPGVYRCVCCGTALFSSGTKFDSGTGWPSYYEPIEHRSVHNHRTGGIHSRCNAAGNDHNKWVHGKNDPNFGLFDLDPTD